MPDSTGDTKLSYSVHDQILIAIGLVVREQRDTLKMSQRELADKCGLNRSYICDIEGTGRSISLKNLSRVAQALDLSMYKLVRLAEQKLSFEGPFKIKSKGNAQKHIKKHFQ